LVIIPPPYLGAMAEQAGNFFSSTIAESCLYNQRRVMEKVSRLSKNDLLVIQRRRVTP